MLIMGSDVLFLHTHISIDCVVFGFDRENRLNILLVEKYRNRDFNNEERKLPGSLVFQKERLDDAAQRVLYELTGIKRMALRQFKCFDDPDRTKKPNDITWMDYEYEPNMDRVITVAYLSICKINQRINSSKYETVDWFPVEEIPELPFDHNLIIKESLSEIRRWIQSDFTILFQLLPKKFTIRELYNIYNALSRNKIDIKNFHKRVNTISYIVPSEETEINVSHRAARYYTFDAKAFKQTKSNLIK